MNTVELRFSALPAHVRTARLVAAAVARRSGVDEAILDEVRLAVGEACSRAVDLHRRYCPGEPVLVTLSDGSDAFEVSVTDRAPAEGTVAGDVMGAFSSVVDLEADALPAGVGLAVISGLVDDFAVDVPAADGVESSSGMVVRMRWPADAHRSG
jgi:anti-sigma regulatory factor (Ser/Thr protein kinase)